MSHLPRFTTGFTPLVLARLHTLLPPAVLDRLRVPLQQLSLGWEESLHVEELQTLATLCPEVVELKAWVKILLREIERLLNEKYAFFCGF